MGTVHVQSDVIVDRTLMLFQGKNATALSGQVEHNLSNI
jgi:hypothetical protein